MARPRVVRTPDGAEVVMKNMSPELADKVKALLSGEDSPNETPEAAQPSVASAMSSGVFNGNAVGTFQDLTDGGKWKVAVIKFNGTTKEATVDKIIVAGTEKPEGVERFKITAAELGLV